MASTALRGGLAAPTEARPQDQAQPLPVKILDNPPTPSLAQALKQSQQQVDNSK